jgi:hypothetical protein
MPRENDSGRFQVLIHRAEFENESEREGEEMDVRECEEKKETD